MDSRLEKLFRVTKTPSLVDVSVFVFSNPRPSHSLLLTPNSPIPSLTLELVSARLDSEIPLTNGEGTLQREIMPQRSRNRKISTTKHMQKIMNLPIPALWSGGGDGWVSKWFPNPQITVSPRSSYFHAEGEKNKHCILFNKQDIHTQGGIDKFDNTMRFFISIFVYFLHESDQNENGVFLNGN